MSWARAARVVTEDLGGAAGEAIARVLEDTATARGHASLAVPGGRSPVPVFRWLAEHHDGGRTRLTWVDERHLPVEPGGSWRSLPAQSNLRLAWEHWLSRTSRPPEVVPMARPGDLDAAARAYTADFEARIGRLDVALLGMGPDGHVASLFPGHAALDAKATCVAVRDSPKPPPERLSLSLPVLADAGLVVLLVTGTAKGAAFARACAGDRSLPLAHLGPRHDLLVLLDPAAATELP